MSLIVFKRPIIQFYLYTTKPFHNRKSAIDFLRLIRSYGPYYLPTKYDFFEPIKQIFNSNDEKKFVRTWFGGSEITDKEAQEQNCEGGFIAKGKPPSKIDYHIMWEHKENTDRFNMICVSIAIPFLKKSSEHMAQFVHFCDDLACLYSPVHAEIRDYISSIPCECTESAFIPDNLNLRCPALKWRTYFGPPYIKLLGKDTILNAPCYKTEEVGETIVLQLTKSVFENIPSELRQEVVNYFEASVDPAIRSKLGTGFLFRPFYASESFSPKNKLVPEFNFDEKNFIPKPNSD